MKRMISVGSGVGVLLLAGSASGAYQGMSAELHHSSAYGDSIRLYVNLDAGDRLDAVYGSAANPLVLGSNSALYQHAAGSHTSADISAFFLMMAPSLAHDSWVTIGMDAGDDTNALSQQTVDFSNFGDEVTTNNGSWYITPDDAQGAEDGGKVLIAQMTIAAGGSADDLYGNLNFQGKLANGDNWSATDQWIPAPGALALLGLAGIAGRRRRRA